MIRQYNKKDGSKWWYFKAYLGIDPVTRKRKYTTRRGFRTKKEAKIALSRLELSAKDGTLTTEKKYSFAEVKDMWLLQYKETVRESTFITVNYLFDKHILLAFSNKQIDSYNVAYCQEVANSWKNKYATHRALKSYTSQVFNYAKQLNIISTNPMDQVNFSKGNASPKKNKIKYFDKYELKDFLELCKKDSFVISLPAFRLLAFTGIRKGELLALEWTDIDFFNKTLKISKTLVSDANNQLKTNPPKTSSSDRVISLDNVTVKILRDWRQLQKSYLLQHGTNANSIHQIIFPSENNNYLSLNRLNTVLTRICKKSGMNDITIHGFRHTHCSILFEAGLSIKDVQDRLGHSDIHTTMNIYTHVTEKQKELSAEKFANFVNF
ncbi:site-specific integrase [Vagococcus salmoninarum]|uniref:Site-specific integrase n=1 Tax=Vagococcus salmoninarum TaxID=2739 RepID=A0A429ZSH8_9ENTE|nr:site-specific integrase [Vagococcus salmoninarum]RST96625.1 site-specific integrase [Vagococcus salmoninarum]